MSAAAHATPRTSSLSTCALISALLVLGTLPASVHAATPCQWEPTYGVDQGLSDDSTTQVNFGFSFPFQGMNYTSGFVSSNGFLALGMDPGSQCCDASLPNFFSGPPRIALAWHDMNPGSGGAVRFQTFPGRAVVTWDAVPEFSSSMFHTIQIQIFDTGMIILAFDVLEPVSTGHRHDTIIGITPGNGAMDPGEVDWSAGVPYATAATGTVYEFFGRAGTGPDPDPFDMSTNAIIFTPLPTGGYSVLDCAASSTMALVRTVDAPDATVAAGSTAHPVSVSVENAGMNTLDVTTVDLSFTGSADRTAEYTVSPAPTNPIAIASGATEVFDFLVDVSPAATLELVTLDAEFHGIDQVTMAMADDLDSDLTDTWDVLGCIAPMCGDCNGDMTLSILDALVAAQNAAALIVLTGVDFTNCNVIGTLEPAPGAAVDILDALTLAQAAAGLPISLVCC